jgi:hypothetical protein
VGDTARVVLSGFSYHEIRDDKAGFPVDRVEHLLDILRWLGNDVADPTAVGDPPVIANGLDQNYPNPFNPLTTIRYRIGAPGHASLRVYDAAGRLVRTLVNESQVPRPEGFAVEWDGRNRRGDAVSSGVYYYRLAAPGYTKTRKMVLLR